MLKSSVFQRCAWTGLIGGFLDQVWSLPGVVSMMLALLAPLTLQRVEGSEHGTMTLGGLGASAGSLLAVIPWVVLAGSAVPHGQDHMAAGVPPSHHLMTAAMVVMGASMGGMLGGGWLAWRRAR